MDPNPSDGGCGALIFDYHEKYGSAGSRPYKYVAGYQVAYVP